MDNFEVLSLEDHLFFARMMKEHAIFLEAGLPEKNADHRKRAERFKIGFEGILSQAAEMGNGIVSGKILRSGELFTDYTLDAEAQTANLTGIMINSRITRQERQMGSCCGRISCGLSAQVEWLNDRALRLADGLTAFQEEILREVTECRLYTANYPLFLEHIIREAKLYCCRIRKLQGYEDGICCEAFPDAERFWNQIMMEHALFIRGLLDPSEDALVCAADDFAEGYSALLEEAGRAECMTAELTRQAYDKTGDFRDFKAAGAKQITECHLRSILLPLLADHVLREANHYLRLLEKGVLI